MQFTLNQIRHADLVTFPEDFEKAWLEHMGDSWFGKFPGLFWFIQEYGHDDKCLELAAKIVASTIDKPIVPEKT